MEIEPSIFSTNEILIKKNIIKTIPNEKAINKNYNQLGFKKKIEKKNKINDLPIYINQNNNEFQKNKNKNKKLKSNENINYLKLLKK